MKIAILAPIAWRTPPRHYGPWEQVASNTCEGLVERGFDVTLFATADSITKGKLDAVCPYPYEENSSIDPKVWECLHISNLMERADDFDLIHSHYDFLPLTYTANIKPPMVTTIHGFTSQKILPVFKKYNKNKNFYVSISNSDRSPDLDYISTVYNGIKIEDFDFYPEHGQDLLFFGRIHPEKGAKESIEIAKASKRRLIIAGIVQDQTYFDQEVKPQIDGKQIVYVGPIGADQRSAMLGKAYALLHPISFEEPFGLSVAEAMACGTPVIAFNRGSMPELIVHEKTGFIVENVQQTCEVLEKIPTIDRKECRNHVIDNFSVDAMIDGYVKVYENVKSRLSCISH